MADLRKAAKTNKDAGDLVSKSDVENLKKDYELKLKLKERRISKLEQDKDQIKKFMKKTVDTMKSDHKSTLTDARRQSIQLQDELAQFRQTGVVSGLDTEK